MDCLVQYNGNWNIGIMAKELVIHDSRPNSEESPKTLNLILIVNKWTIIKNQRKKICLKLFPFLHHLPSLCSPHHRGSSFEGLNLVYLIKVPFANFQKRKNKKTICQILYRLVMDFHWWLQNKEQKKFWLGVVSLWWAVVVQD